MTGSELEWALNRLPDGSLRRREERAAAAALAADALLAAAAKAAEVLSAAQLAAAQRAAARELADRDQAWTDFRGWRVNYDEPLLGLCALVEPPPAPWGADG